MKNSLVDTLKNRWVLGHLLILCGAVYLYLYQLSSHMIFFGDIGWYYLQARDMVLGQGIPLVGIPSSHPWLHQGAFWTYILAGALYLGRFNPVAGGYGAVIMSTVTLLVLTYTTRRIFSYRVGLITLLLYATSPLVIIHARMPYHTTPIPLFTLCYVFFVYLWITKGKRFFPFIIGSLVILYNFEIASVLLTFYLVFLLGMMFIFKPQSVFGLWDKKVIGLSFVMGIVPLIPMILYDISHGFPQTVKFVVWLGYRLISLTGLIEHGEISTSWSDFFTFSLVLLQRLLFAQNGLVALGIGVLVFLFAVVNVLKVRQTKKIDSVFLICSLFLVLLCGYIGNHIPSEAYTPMFFPVIFIVLALCIDGIFRYKQGKYVAVVLLTVLSIFNLITLFSNKYYVGVEEGYGPSFSQRELAVKQILSDVHGNAYNVGGRGEGSEYESYTMNYEYLGWYLGNDPQKNMSPTFSIQDTDKTVIIKKIYD